MIKDDLLDFAIAMPKRFSKLEKANYIEALMIRFKEFGFDGKLAKSNIKGKIANNIIIGDIKKAKLVLMSNYDTPSRVYSPNYKYYPFSPKENIKQEKISLAYQAIFVLIWLFLTFVTFYLGNIMNGIARVTCYVCAALFLIVSIFTIRTKANVANLTRNSSSIALMLEMARRINGNQIAFVLLDQNAQSYIGLNQFNQYLKENKININGLVVRLDCIAFGSKVVVGYGSALIEEIKKLSSYFKQDNLYPKEYSNSKLDQLGLGLIGNQIQISVGDIINNQFFVTNTRTKKDVHINVDQCLAIAEMLEKYVQKGEKNEKINHSI